MNFQAKRIQTFYLLKNFTAVEKNFITMRGFYYEANRLICYKCEISISAGRNRMDAVGSHQCGTRKNLARNVEIMSPYTETPGTINVIHDLNYEEFRYATFTKWTMASLIKVNMLDLASAGFYYAKSPQTLKCFYCKTVVHAMELPNRTITLHKTNKKCLQKKFSLQIRMNNLSRDDLSRPLREKHTLPTSINEAGPSSWTISATNSSPTVDSPVASARPIQQAFDKFLSDPEKKLIYAKALKLGFDKEFVNTIIKRRLEYESTFENIEELIEFCFTFEANSKLARKMSRDIELFEREMECKICMNEKVAVIFKPCHHVIACSECGEKVSACPICCKKIDECSKIYF